MPPRKEEEIVIPEAVMNRANAAAMRGQAIADTGSIFTNRERAVDFRGAGAPSFSQQGGLPRFPFGGASSTFLDITDRNFDFGQDAPAGGFTRTNPSTTFASTQNQANVQYTQDAASRIANRYTLPTGYFNNPFGSRLSNTLYSNPERAASIENRRAELNNYSPLPSSPNVGAAGFGRNIETREGGGGGGVVEQIVSPYGFASTNLTQQQREQRADAYYQAERMGTMPRTPEQQQALLAQMREAGAKIAQDYTQTMKDFAESRGPRFSPMPAPQGRYGQPLVNLFPQSQEMVAQKVERNAPVLASTGFGTMQRAQQESIPQPLGRSPLFSGMGYTAAFGGGPQPSRSMMAYNDQEDTRARFRRTLGLV